jgi:hypothetical protein
MKQVLGVLSIFAGLLLFTLALPIWLLSNDWIGTAILVYGFGVVITGMFYQAMREAWREINHR